MSRTFVYFFILFLRALNSGVYGLVVSSSIEDFQCPSGTIKVVNYVQRYRQDPYQPEIYTTDCVPAFGSSLSKNHASPSRNVVPLQLVRRQSSCADRPMCYGIGATAPSLSDCSDLVTFLTNRASTQTLIWMQAVTVTSGTCQFTLTTSATSMEFSDITWASQSAALTQACIPSKPWAMCIWGGFTLQVTTPIQLSQTTTTTANAATTSTGIVGTSNDGGTSTNENTAATTSSSSTALTTANSTSSFSSGTATSSNVIPIFSIGIPQTSSSSQDSSQAVGQISTGNEDSTGGNRTSNIPAAIGGVLGAIALVLFIAAGIWIWRRNRRRAHETLASESEESDATQQVVNSSFMLEVSSPEPPLSLGPVKRSSNTFVSPLPPANPVLPSVLPSSDSAASTAENGAIPIENGYQTQGMLPPPLAANIPGEGIFLPLPPTSNVPPPLQLNGPQLSEDAINHMADTILAQMPLTARGQPIHEDPPRLGELASDVVSPGPHTEAPPPWSESMG
ncbi:hypothetical protein FRB91_007527 [Serendipita sp. 411]|nr:hypothetical protein FRB91_007527 [Serendipita sp. 411]